MPTSAFVLTIFSILVLLHVYRYEISAHAEAIKLWVKKTYWQMKHGSGGMLTFAT